MDFNEYTNYLVNKAKIPENQISYYLGWITQFFAFCNKTPGQRFDQNEMHGFLEHLGGRCEDWQVNQAQKAIELFRYHQSHYRQSGKRSSTLSSGAWGLRNGVVPR